MNAGSSNAAPSSQAMTPEFIEQLAELRQLKAALESLPHEIRCGLIEFVRRHAQAAGRPSRTLYHRCAAGLSHSSGQNRFAVLLKRAARRQVEAPKCAPGGSRANAPKGLSPAARWLNCPKAGARKSENHEP